MKDTPNIVHQLNLYKDKTGLLKVHSKMERYNFPLLLSKKSRIIKLIILNYHEKLAHSRCYAILAELRKFFWIPHFFTVAKNPSKNACIVKDLMLGL